MLLRPNPVFHSTFYEFKLLPTIVLCNLQPKHPQCICYPPSLKRIIAKYSKRWQIDSVNHQQYLRANRNSILVNFTQWATVIPHPGIQTRTFQLIQDQANMYTSDYRLLIQRSFMHGQGTSNKLSKSMTPLQCSTDNFFNFICQRYIPFDIYMFHRKELIVFHTPVERSTARSLHHNINSSIG